MKKLALVSVYDKDGLEEFAQGLVKLGFSILSTGGTANFLKDHGIEVISVSDYTGAPEICSGRVKTLHPKIHGGILARRHLESDIAEIKREGIDLIDIVVVNLYPFTEQVSKALAGECQTDQSLVEYIDIGGPTMIRAAAKNCADVLPICDPLDYPQILLALQKGTVSQEFRRELAAKVFRTMAAYDAAISSYFGEGERIVPQTPEGELLRFDLGLAERVEKLRYGENPHQHAGLYRLVEVGKAKTAVGWKQLAGKELSYNNLMDVQGAVELLMDLRNSLPNYQSSVIIKHTNPCGVACCSTALDAFRQARDCDPISAFGGIVALNGVVDKKLAEVILEGFVEVVCAPQFTDDALLVFDKKKAVRLLECDYDLLNEQRLRGRVVRSFFNDYLVQTPDVELGEIDLGKCVTDKSANPDHILDYTIGWIVCKHVKSNAIVIVRGARAIGVGAGQMSRVDSARLAIDRARLHGHDLTGAVAASDAFLPFPDTLEVLAEVGVVGLVQPGGSIRDRDVIQTANEKGVSMLLTGYRHFRH